MYEVLIAVRDPGTSDLLRAAFAERKVFRASATPRERLAQILRPPSTADVVALDIDPNSSEDRAFLASLRAINGAVQFVGVGPSDQGQGGAAARLTLDVRTFVRAPVDPFDLARRLNRLAEALASH